MSPLTDLTPYIAVAGVSAVAVAVVVLQRRTTHRSLPFPPGPNPLPLVGNLFDLPKEKAWLTYGKWNDQYGDVVCLDVLGQKLVILGSAVAVHNLLEQRGNVYSSRASTTMMDLVEAKWALSLLPYGDLWRRQRRLIHAHVNQGVADRYHPTQTTLARRFARDILSTALGKEMLPRAVRLNFAQTILKAVYGIDVESYDSEYIALPEQVNDITVKVLTPGQFLVDSIPLLKYVPAWFPGAGFQRLIRDSKDMQRRMLENPINLVRKQMAEGTAPVSMAQAMLEDDATLPFQQSQLDMIKNVTGQAYLAGSDTTMATVLSFFLAMLVYPEVQAKAQAEVDRIVGTHRLPELADRMKLPYVQGVVNECLRWLPVTPLGVPHMTTKDDEYNGYFIPKGSIIFASVLRILHNVEDYPDPECFRPERYLTPDGQLNPSVRDPRTACFGFGRRICPGRFFADTSLFVTVATLLATVNVVRAKDEQGNEIVPEVDVTGGGLSHPKPFPWAVRTRNQHSRELLSSALA